MSADIIDFPIGRPFLGRRPRREITAWVPDYRNKWIDGVGVTYWTGKETLCRLVKNPNYTGDPKIYPHENPYIYETIGEWWDPIQREATPPDCPPAEFNWDEFEEKAVWS